MNEFQYTIARTSFHIATKIAGFIRVPMTQSSNTCDTRCCSDIRDCVRFAIHGSALIPACWKSSSSCLPRAPQSALIHLYGQQELNSVSAYTDAGQQ